MPNNAERWQLQVRNYDINRAVETGQTLTATEVAQAVKRLHTMLSYENDADYSNALVLAAVQLPYLDGECLQQISRYFSRARAGLDEACVGVFTHPACTEDVATYAVTHAAVFGSSDVNVQVSSAATRCGWLSPTAQRLALARPDHAFGSVSFTAAQILRELEHGLIEAPGDARTVVLTLGATWKGSVADLLAVALSVSASSVSTS